ncbi:hypothetical protein MBLNU457_g0440t1 [Dothideomycetes sp. NU457]
MADSDSARAIIEGIPISTSEVTTVDALTRIPSVKKMAPKRLEEFIPPLNYGAVEEGIIFRSAFPQPENYAFIKSIRVRTIITLVEKVPEEYAEFISTNNIQHFRIPVPANKDGVISVTSSLIESVLDVVLNRAHHPLLIHCNRGKHRTGCVIATLRQIQSYSTAFAIDEYKDYAFPKARPDDIKFIESYDGGMRHLAIRYGWINTPPPEPTTPYMHMQRSSAEFRLGLEEIANIRLPESDGENQQVDEVMVDDEVMVEEMEIDSSALTPIDEGMNGYQWNSTVSEL